MDFHSLGGWKQPAVERSDLIDLFYQKKIRPDSRNECS
jgi:hypothetical protein